MASPPLLGPIALCTLVAADGAALVAAYTGWLHQQVAVSGPLDSATASAIGQPQLAGNPSWLLQNTAGRAWLQVIECPRATPRDHLATYGWLAMEVLVADVDQLAASLADSPFELLRPAANLDLSDQIRACQVRGPAGEILYLTQVKAPVPPSNCRAARPRWTACSSRCCPLPRGHRAWRSMRNWRAVTASALIPG